MLRPPIWLAFVGCLLGENGRQSSVSKLDYSNGTPDVYRACTCSTAVLTICSGVSPQHSTLTINFQCFAANSALASSISAQQVSSARQLSIYAPLSVHPHAAGDLEVTSAKATDFSEAKFSSFAWFNARSAVTQISGSERSVSPNFQQLLY
jgi:hypothetical protein